MNGLNGQAIGVYTPVTVAVTGAGTSVPNTIEEVTVGAGFTRTLPLASSCPGQIFEYIVMDATGSGLTVACSGSDKILTQQGLVSSVILWAQSESLKIQSDGTQFIPV